MGSRRSADRGRHRADLHAHGGRARRTPDGHRDRHPGHHTDTTRTSLPTEVVGDGTLSSTPTPTVTGTPKVDVELTGVPGTWDDGVTLSYQWSSQDAPIDGATSLRFVPTEDLVGHTVTFAVTGAKPGYTSVTRSVETAPVAEADPGNHTNTPTPTIDGTPQVDVQLTGVPGTWDDGVTLTYQWSTDGTPIDGATAATFTPGAGLVGQTLTFSVTGTKPGFNPATRSADTAPVAEGDLTATPTPTITGDPVVGETLTADAGTWDDGATLTYQWLANSAPITDADQPTFVATSAEVGTVLTVAVTGTKAGYTEVTRVSEPTATVTEAQVDDPEVASSAPTVRGRVQVGRTVRIVAGAWEDGATFAVQWLLDGQAIPGADQPRYAVQPDDARHALSVALTGSKPGYTTVTRISDARTVAYGVQSAKPKPRITGGARIGRTLRARPGPHDAEARLVYHWRVGGKAVRTRTATLPVRRAYRGKRIWVKVTAKKAGYRSVSGVSRKVGPVKR